MVNEIILVGKLHELPKKIKVINQDKYHQFIITLDVVHHIKNNQGLYDHDFIDITIWKGMKNTIEDVCEIGDLIAVKGRIQQIEDKQIIIAEKVNYLNKFIHI